MSYINGTLNHFRAIQRWAAASGGQATLDAARFTLEVKHRNRYFRLVPMFVAMTEGRMSYLPQLTEDVVAFAGWLPYRPYEFDLAKDKLLFKQAMVEANLPTPAWWPAPEDATTDYVLKRSRGSFGLQLSGPYRAGTPAAQITAPGGEHGTVFAETFVEGRIVKVWFWGAKPFFAHVHEFPTVVADGITPIGQLVANRLQSAADQRPDALATSSQCIAFQGFDPNSPVAADRQVWIDFRYGRRYAPNPPATISDDSLATFEPAARATLETTGAHLARLLKSSFNAPVAYALDGILDDSGQLRWLEMNSNPIVPPAAYASMFDDLFT